MNTATEDQCKHFRNAWLTEALQDLKRYPAVPFVTDFMKRHGLPVSSSRKQMLGIIQKHVNSKKKNSLKFSDLIEYLDELRLYGKQDVILFDLKQPKEGETDKYRQYINKIKKPEAVRDILREKGLEDRFDNNVCCWMSGVPFLSEVKYQASIRHEAIARHEGEAGDEINPEENREQLSFKWVRTRDYHELVNGVLVVKQERSVNFFIIDLHDGSAQLRIQTLPNQPLVPLADEILLYLKEVNKLIKLTYFKTAYIASVMQHFLLMNVLPFAVWAVKIPPTTDEKRGYIRGAKVNPNIFDKVLINKPGVVPYQITMHWDDCPHKVKKHNLFFSIDNNYKTIEFNAITNKFTVEYVLNKIHEAAGKCPRLELPPPSKPPVPPNNEGVRVWLLDNFRVLSTGLPRLGLEAIPVASAGLIRGLFHAFSDWAIEESFESVFHVPFVVPEVLLYILLIVLFYGRRGIIIWAYNTWGEINEYISLFLKETASEAYRIIINGKNYLTWVGGKPA